MKPKDLEQILHDIQLGRLSVKQALSRIAPPAAADLGFANLDLERQQRCGIPEVVYCAGKTPKQIIQIIRRLEKSGQNILATRCDDSVAAIVRRSIKGLKHHPEARILTKSKTPPAVRHGSICILCAGTSDLPIAEEAAVTCEFLGLAVQRCYDVGVAGLHRLVARLDDIRKATVIICIAGMEGALPSVVAGLVDCPVIAVPTSIGYGASFHGLTALLAMLNSCAPGISVVNIDNGFGAATCADNIIRAIENANPPHKPTAKTQRKTKSA